MNTIENFDEQHQIELHPGFRFHPTDEELITYYLAPKVLDTRFKALAMGEADLNKIEPWDLPRIAKMGEEEWYFFCVRDKKYPTGMRTNRATESGYWKATGKDKEIYRGKSLVGMKKTLVFYRGRAPKGIKTNWVIHEYRLDGKYSKNNLPKTAKNEWVISRVFNKSSTGKKTHISELTGVNYRGEESEPPLPALTEASPYNNRAFETKPTVGISPRHQTPSSSLTSNNQSQYYPHGFQFSDSDFSHDQSVLKLLIDGNGDGDGNDLSSCFVANEDDPIDLDCLINY